MLVPTIVPTAPMAPALADADVGVGVGVDDAVTPRRDGAIEAYKYNAA